MHSYFRTSILWWMGATYPLAFALPSSQGAGPFHVGAVMSFTEHPDRAGGFLEQGHAWLCLEERAPQEQRSQDVSGARLTFDGEIAELAGLSHFEHQKAWEWDYFDPDRAALISLQSEGDAATALVYLGKNALVVASSMASRTFPLEHAKKIWDCWGEAGAVHVLLGACRT